MQHVLGTKTWGPWESCHVMVLFEHFKTRCTVPFPTKCSNAFEADPEPFCIVKYFKLRPEVNWYSELGSCHVLVYIVCSMQTTYMKFWRYFFWPADLEFRMFWIMFFWVVQCRRSRRGKLWQKSDGLSMSFPRNRSENRVTCDSLWICGNEFYL